MSAVAEATFVDRPAFSREASELLAAVAASKQQDDNAANCYRMAIELDDENAAAWNGLGRYNLARKSNTAALYAFENVIRLKPSASAWVNYGEAYRRLGDYAEAHRCVDKALAMNPVFSGAHVLKTAILEMSGSEAELRAAIEAGIDAADCPELRFARAQVELANYDYANGWRDYEYRPSRLELVERLDNVPEWKGEDLTGKTLVVCGEQGLGDQILFSRFMKALPSAASVYLFTRPELARLFSRLDCAVITSDRELLAVDADYWIGMGSLSLRTGAPPHGGEYLSEYGEDIRLFKSLIPEDGTLRVGLNWAGNPKFLNDERRSMHFDQLRPLLKVPGCTFYSLQSGAAASQCEELVNLSAYCHDIADLAGAMKCLDVVVTTCTMTAHLAGAIRVPCYVMLHDTPYWVWGKDRATRWYQSCAAFRQERSGDWFAVVQSVSKRLELDAAAKVEDAVAAPIEPPARVMTELTRYGKMSFYLNDRYIGRSLRLYGEYSESEAVLFRDLLKPGDVVVEAGANIGALTAPLSVAVGDSGRVYAFEPAQAYFDLLTENTATLGNVHAVRIGIAKQRGSVDLPGAELDRVSAPSHETGLATETAEVLAIDELGLGRIGFLKIDVDGLEGEIIEGARKSIGIYRPVLYVEYDKPEKYPDLISSITALGYKVWSHMAPLYNPENFAGYHVNVFGSIVSGMLLCVPNEKFLDQKIIDKHGLNRVRARKVN